MVQYHKVTDPDAVYLETTNFIDIPGKQEHNPMH